MSSTVLSVREALELGNHYARNYQWHNALIAFTEALDKVYSNVGEGLSLGEVLGAHEAVSDVGKTKHSTASVDDYPALKQLREAQIKAHRLPDVESARFIRVFRTPSAEEWTVVYHNCKVLTYGTLEIALPIGTSNSFIVRFQGDSVTSVALSEPVAVRLAYALSHIGWAWVSIMNDLYSQNHILIDNGDQMIEQQGRYYDCALAIRPGYSWVLRRIAEMHRYIVNGWPASTNDLLMPSSRVEGYVRAIVYYKEAIKYDDDSFWAHAHLGAVIVNIRAFVYYLEESDKIPALFALLKEWFPEEKTPMAQYESLLEQACSLLMKAQEELGNFYPWAQEYYADALLLKSVAKEKETNAFDTLLAAVNIIDANFLQPKLAAQVVEPGELYNCNGFFQFGLLYYHLKQYDHAWNMTRIGMGRSFSFRFIPGLDLLLGYQILVHIAAGYIASIGADTEAGVSSPDPTAGAVYAAVSIPEKPIDKEQDLIKFMNEVFERACKPCVDPFKRKEAASGVNIQISLLQAMFILKDFEGILARVVDKGAESLKARLEKYRKEIQDVVSLRIEDSPTGSNDQPNQLYAMFAQVNINKLNYHTMTRVKKTS